MNKHKLTKATDIPVKVKEIVWERDNHCCIICGNPQAMPNAHYIARSQLGLGIEKNIVSLCPRCHYDYDNGEHRKKYKHVIANYLRAKYPDWKEEDLIYKKWGGANG